MKPSEIKTVTAKKTVFLLPHFRALTWKGTVYCKYKSDVDSINKHDYIDSTLKSHETIHVRQAESMKDSWFRFYLKYIIEWICNLPLVFVNLYAPYRFMPIEMEAYQNEKNWKYATNGAVCGWKELEKLTLKEKWKLAKKHYKK